jgi:hypothetical protein
VGNVVRLSAYLAKPFGFGSSAPVSILRIASATIEAYFFGRPIGFVGKKFSGHRAARSLLSAAFAKRRSSVGDQRNLLFTTARFAHAEPFLTIRADRCRANMSRHRCRSD